VNMRRERFLPAFANSNGEIMAATVQSGTIQKRVPVPPKIGNENDFQFHFI
jgi:hypothetical protein